MGLQTVDRAVAVLQLLSTSGPGGLRLVDVQGKLRLSKPTTHRLLTSLASHGFIDQHETTRRYRLGERLAVLAWSVPHRRLDFGRVASPAAQRLAQRTGDSVFVIARDGLETACVGRETGSFPIQALTIVVGTRRPLGVGAGGLAVLGSMPPGEARRAIDTIAPRLKDYPLTSPEVILRSADQARRLGYSVSDGQVATGVRAVAVAVRDARGEAVGALSIAAIRSRMMPDRIRELVPWMVEERAGIERLLAT